MALCLSYHEQESPTQMESRRLEDRIRRLLEKAIATNDPDDFHKVTTELAAALKEHTKRLREMAAKKASHTDRRK